MGGEIINGTAGTIRGKIGTGAELPQQPSAACAL
jgi:hypothetical protein